MSDQDNRRTQERFSVNAQTACEFMSPVLEDVGPVRIKNVSNNGIGLVTNQKFEPGWLLAITLANKDKGFSKTMLVRVVHVTPQAGGAYLVGATFQTPLTYDELCTMVM